MERWEYIEVRFSRDEQYLYIRPQDKIDHIKIKQALKDQAKVGLDKTANCFFIIFDYKINQDKRWRSNFLLALNILGQSGWEAFSASDSKDGQSIFLKRRIEK
jgi:hypothetical protein